MPKLPHLKLCSINEDGHLTIPKAEREKWLSDPVRSGLIKFDFNCFVRLLCCVVASGKGT